jgi:pyruvate-formate lyase-activating enzyme
VASRVFHLFLIKPSHYDDDGYVIQWLRSTTPSNSLASVYGLALDSVRRQVLGPDVEIRITALDETNSRVRPDRMVAAIRAAGGRGLVGLIGVQSNQFPRAVDIARPLRAAGIAVCIGGFHVSGCLAMLPDVPPDIQAALDLGISVFAGEAEAGRLDAVLRDADAGTLQPIYDFMDDLPGMAGTPSPFLPADIVRRTSSARTSFDAGRGCPFTCSFCTIINVQGRKSRTRSADDVERIVRENIAQGIVNFFITDDNLARNANWEAIFDRLIAMREQEGLRPRIIAQVDTMCHRIKGFVEKAARAGVDRVFIGLESINPDALKDAKKGQNQIGEYRAMLQAWHGAGAVIFAGYILGFPGDTPESIERDIRIIQRELPIDILEFFILTPLPGSADHQRLYTTGVPMDPDMNKYDLVHVTTPHATMSAQTLIETYYRAWDLYYTPEHFETVMRRAKTWGYHPWHVMMKMLVFYAIMTIERVHPLDGGLLRRKVRTDRRHGMPLEHPLTFYPRYAWNLVAKHARFARLYLRYSRLAARVCNDTSSYADVAITPAQQSDVRELELFTATAAARTVQLKLLKRQEVARSVAGSLHNPDR